MKNLILAALLPWLAGPALAASSGKGTTAAAFLKLAPGARGAAMGESLGGSADDAYAAWYNPAGLGFLERVEAGAAHESRLAGISYDAAVLAVPVLSWRDSPLRANAYGTTALSVYSLSASGIERRGLVETDAPSGTFAAADRAYSLSYGLAPRGGPWAFGGTVKLVDSSLDSRRATAMTFDGGALWRGERSSFGAGARNFGGRLSYGGVSDPLPTAYYAGGGWRPREGWLVTAELSVPKEDAAGLGLGVERSWTPAPGLQAAVRGGYASARSDGGGIAGLSLGFGVTWRAVEADFAWAPSGTLGDFFKYSLLFRFGEGRPGGISRDKAGWR
ncbi:MAG: PorV/PorQ family protein [Elusimicrobiota bacterium]|nr:MAG: PorV/PorQ family protein [Elusimicrobiota bacterium]